MANKTLFSYLNWIDADGVVFEPDSETTTLLGENVASRLSHRIWRTVFSGGNTNAGMSIDLGVSRSIQVLFIQFPRYNGPDDYGETPDFAATDTIRFRLSNTTPDDGDVYDSTVLASGVLAGFGAFCIVLDAAVTARYVRVDFDAQSRETEGFLDVSRMWFGPKLESQINITWGGSLSWQSDSVLARAARSTTTYISVQESTRLWQFNFDNILDSERNAFEDFERRMTIAGQFIVVLDDLDSGRNCMMGRMQSSTGLSFMNRNKNTKAFRVVEDY